jgi:hypothetical protein
MLQLSQPCKFKVGDQVIVEVGAEEGRGRFGTMGVGGICPAARDGWTRFYYRSKDVPISLVAKIAAITNRGKTLSLDKEAATRASGANVHFDNYPLLQRMLWEWHPAGRRIVLPAGDFAVSDKLYHAYSDGWTISGAGKGTTILRSPKGVPGGGLHCFKTTNTDIRNFTIIGNAGENGFGLKEHWNGRTDYGIGVLFTESDNCVVHNVDLVDVFRKAVWGEFTSGLQVHDCGLTLREPFRGYLEWWFGVSDSSNSVFARCRVDSKYLVGGFETFRSDKAVFIDCSAKNATFSSNSSGNFMLDGFALTITAGAQFDEESFSQFNPAVNINTNIQPPSKTVVGGGTIRNVSIRVDGPIDSHGNLLKGIVINKDNPNVTVDGGLIDYPDGRLGAVIGPFGVDATGDNAIIRNLTVTGEPANSWESNIYVRNGIVTECRAKRIRVDSSSRT